MLATAGMLIDIHSEATIQRYTLKDTGLQMQEGRVRSEWLRECTLAAKPAAGYTTDEVPMVTNRSQLSRAE